MQLKIVLVRKGEGVRRDACLTFAGSTLSELKDAIRTAFDLGAEVFIYFSKACMLCCACPLHPTDRMCCRSFSSLTSKGTSGMTPPSCSWETAAACMLSAKQGRPSCLHQPG